MNKFIQISRNNRGFTLIELMIVLVVLGILAGIAIPQITDIRNDAKVSTARSELASLRGQFISYNARHDDWPDSEPDSEDGALGQMWKEMSNKYTFDYTGDENNLNGAKFGVALDVTGDEKADWIMSDQGIKAPDNSDEDIGIGEWSYDLSP